LSEIKEPKKVRQIKKETPAAITTIQSTTLTKVPVATPQVESKSKFSRLKLMQESLRAT
jgi:hypothetical protein